MKNYTALFIMMLSSGSSNKAKARTSHIPPSSEYWRDATNNTQKTTQTGYKLKESTAQVNKALVPTEA